MKPLINTTRSCVVRVMDDEVSPNLVMTMLVVGEFGIVVASLWLGL